MLNATRLRVLREVLRSGSLSAAAERLSYTQSAVSQQIAALEREVGLRLLERSTRGVRPTQAGRRLAAHAEAVLSQLEAAERELQELAGLGGGNLRLASFASAGSTLLPEAVARFRSRYPAVELTLAEGEPEEIAPRLCAGEFDLALLFQFGSGEPLRPYASRLKLEPLLEDPMYLAVPAGHPLAGRPTVRLKDLAGEALIQTSARTACARYVVRAAHAAGFEPRVSFESDDYLTVQGLVAAGVGVALIPRLALNPVRDGVVVRTLSPRPPLRKVIVGLRRDVPPAPAVKPMVELLKAVAADFSAAVSPA